MSDFKAKNVPNSLSAGVLPHTPLESLVYSAPQTLWLYLRPTIRQRGGRRIGGERKRKEKER